MLGLEPGCFLLPPAPSGSQFRIPAQGDVGFPVLLPDLPLGSPVFQSLSPNLAVKLSVSQLPHDTWQLLSGMKVVSALGFLILDPASVVLYHLSLSSSLMSSNNCVCSAFHHGSFHSCIRVEKIVQKNSLYFFDTTPVVFDSFLASGMTRCYKLL